MLDRDVKHIHCLLTNQQREDYKEWKCIIDGHKHQTIYNIFDITFHIRDESDLHINVGKESGFLLEDIPEFDDDYIYDQDLVNSIIANYSGNKRMECKINPHGALGDHGKEIWCDIREPLVKMEEVFKE